MMIQLRAIMLAAALAAVGAPAGAQEVTLRAVSALPEKTLYSGVFERFIDEVNAKGRGAVRIQYLGGAPKVMGIFEIGKNLKDGVIDLANLTNAFYTNVMPEADAFKLLEHSVAELRGPAKPALDYMQALYREKMNALLLGRYYEAHSFHLYLNTRIERADLTGLKIRVSPVYRAMVEALGGTAITTAPSDAYTMLERGSVDGYGWPLHGIFDFSWQKVTKFRVEPPFYRGEMSILVGLGAWSRLGEAGRRLLQETAIALEATNAEDLKANDAERRRQAEAGIQPIALPDAEAKKWLATAREAGWSALVKSSPEHGPRLRDLFTKK